MKNQTKHLQIRTKKLMNSLFVGNFKSAFHGRGIEFQDFREYTPTDDAKYIDWAVSGREGKTIMRRYREDKEGTVLCIFNETESLKYRDGVKYELAQEIVVLLGQVSLQSGDRFGGYRLTDTGPEYIAPVKSQITLERFISQKTPQSGSKKISLDFLLKSQMKRNIIFVVSDTLDIDEKSFKIAALKHDVVYLHISSHFENTLEGGGVEGVRGFGGASSINLGDIKKKKLYQEKRREQLQKFSKKLRKLGIHSAFFDEKKSIFGEFFALMKERER
ncbi:DUF58 domain-containing protein [Candidatus Gracilibacteria bacterium]|nr:DUF58 domain-containing protein [Candidatus Gracilibacteria bacterium]